MAFKINKVFDLRGIICMVLSAIPLIVSTNIDCNGKPFHCINTTHFMICVDLGGGVSSTVDNFVIPCPPTTVCQGTNRFECEFAPTTPKIEVIPTDGAHNVEINATTSLPDVIATTKILTTSNGILFEENFSTVSTTSVSEKEAVQLTLLQNGEFVTNQFGNEENKSVSNPLIDTDKFGTDFNISKESINLFTDKKSEIIAIANITNGDGKEPIIDHLLTLQNGDITTKASNLELFSSRKTTYLPTEVTGTTTDVADITRNKGSSTLETGGFTNKTYYDETNSEIVTTESVFFENLALTNGIVTELPVNEITTDKPQIIETNPYTIKYNKIDMFNTTEKYHDTISADNNLSMNYSKIGIIEIFQTLPTKNESINNTTITDTGLVSIVDMTIDFNTTAYNTNYYEKEIVKTSQQHYETITEAHNPAADLIVTESSQLDFERFQNTETEPTPGYDAVTHTDTVFTMPLAVKNMNSIKENKIILSNSTETADVIFITESNLINEVSANYHKNEDYTFESLELTKITPPLKGIIEANHSIMKILKGETSTVFDTTESRPTTTGRLTIELNKEFSSTTTNSEVNNSTETIQELYLTSTDINSTNTKTIDFLETFTTPTADSAWSDGTTQSVLISNNLEETSTTANTLTITNKYVNNSTEILQEVYLTSADFNSKNNKKNYVLEKITTTTADSAWSDGTTQTVLISNTLGETSTTTNTPTITNTGVNNPTESLQEVYFTSADFNSKTNDVLETFTTATADWAWSDGTTQTVLISNKLRETSTTTNTPTITNTEVNNSTESLQEVYFTSADFNSKTNDVLETFTTATADWAWSDGTTQTVLISNKLRETSTTTNTPTITNTEVNNSTESLQEIYPTSTDINSENKKNKYVMESLTTATIDSAWSDSSNINFNKQYHEAPRLQLSMPLLQDNLTESPMAGQVEDNFSNKINNRTTQVKNKENLQLHTDIVIPAIVAVQYNPEITTGHTTNAPASILTEELITTTATYSEIQSSQHSYLEKSLMGYTQKKSVNRPVQTGKLSELFIPVMNNVTTPDVIYPSYSSTPTLTKSYQELLNKSNDFVMKPIKATDVQIKESINERNPLTLNMSQHMNTGDTKETETLTTSPKVDEISPITSLLSKINKNGKNDKFIDSTPLNSENTFQINNSNVSFEILATSSSKSNNRTNIQPSDFSMIISPELDAAGSIQKDPNNEQINSQKGTNQNQHISKMDTKIESPSTISSLIESIDQQKTRKLFFSADNLDEPVTIKQNPKLIANNPLDVIESIPAFSTVFQNYHHTVSNRQSELAHNKLLNLTNNLSLTTESYLAKLQPSEIKNTPNNHLNKQNNTNLNKDSTPLVTGWQQATSDNRSDFQNVSDHNLSRKYFVAESLPVAKYILDSNRVHISELSLKVNVTEYATKNNCTTETETTDQINKSHFNCINYSRGRYGDKDDCRKFYICVGKLQPIKGMCPVDTVFSEIRKQCTNNLSQCIRNNQFVCTSEGRFGDFLQDNVYYVCVKNSSTNHHYIRFKLQCQNGYYLNKTSVKCVPKVTASNQSLSSNQSLTSNSENTNKRSLSATLISHEINIPSRNKFKCEDEGKFADPNDCRKYYVCYKNSKSVLKRKKNQCDSNEVFDNDTKKCKDSESYECS